MLNRGVVGKDIPWKKVVVWSVVLVATGVVVVWGLQDWRVMLKCPDVWWVNDTPGVRKKSGLDRLKGVEYGYFVYGDAFDGEMFEAGFVSSLYVAKRCGGVEARHY